MLANVIKNYIIHLSVKIKSVNYLLMMDIEEVLWNEWVMSFIDPKFRIEIKQVYPKDL